MTEKSKIILKKPEKAHIFYEDLEPKFFRETKKSKVQKRNKIG
jgi:hypothetical protein